MNKLSNQTTKKILSFLLVMVFTINLISSSISLGFSSEESLNPTQNVKKDYNPYNSVNCTKLGEYDSNHGSPSELFVAEQSSRTLAFIRELYGILVLDITDPENPYKIDHLFKQERFNAIYVSGDLLFLSNYSNDLLIYNVRDLYNPSMVFNGYFNANYIFFELFVEDDVLYTCDYYDGFVAFNISNPWSPQFISRFVNFEYSNRFYDLFVRDQLAFICQNNVFQVLNLSDIYNPSLVGTFLADRLNADFREIILADDKAYLCADDGCLYILDISDVSNITQLALIWDDSQEFEDFRVDGSIGYLLSYDEGLLILNMTDLQQIKYLHKEYNAGEYRSLELYKGYPILLDYREGLEIYKVDQNYKAELVTRFWDGGYGRDVKVSGKFAYVANAHNGLEIYKIRNSLTPVLKSRISLGFTCQEVFINKNLVYTFDDDRDYLYTIDVSNKRNPKIISAQSLRIEIDNETYYPVFVKIFGDQAFVSLYGWPTGYVAILDLSNSSGFQLTELIPFSYNTVIRIFYEPPYLFLAISSYRPCLYLNNGTHWEQVYEINLPRPVYDIFIQGNITYFATSDELVLYNISNPLEPFIVSTFHGSDISYEGYDRVFVENDLAYLITAYNDNLHIVDVKDKEHIRMVGTFDCNDTLTDIFVVDNVVYLTSAFVNLEIIQLDRFVSLLNYIIYSPIVIMATIIGVPIIIVAVVRIRRRRTAIDTTPTTQLLPREEIQEPTQDTENDSDLSVSPGDYDDPKVLALAKKIAEAVEKGSK